MIIGIGFFSGIGASLDEAQKEMTASGNNRDMRIVPQTGSWVNLSPCLVHGCSKNKLSCKNIKRNVAAWIEVEKWKNEKKSQTIKLYYWDSKKDLHNSWKFWARIDCIYQARI